MTKYIEKTDTLNDGREKLNAAIKAFDETVVEGDSSVEAAQARVDEKGVTHPTLKARIDDGLNSVNQQLAQTTTQVVEGLSTKRDKSVKINKNDYDLSKDSNLWNINEFDEGTRAIIQGLTPGQVNAVLGYKNVKVENAAFIEQSSNLLDIGAMYDSYNFDNSTGELVENDLFGVSEFIPVKQQTDYTSAFIAKVGRYDANYNYIDRVSPTNGINWNTQEAVYIRVVIDLNSYNVAQLNEGVVLLPYEKYSIQLIDELGGLKDKEVTSEKIDDKAVEFNHLSFIEESSNLFNKETVQEGVTINSTTGEIIENSDHNLSDFIKVIPSKKYVVDNVSRRAWYDENKNFIASTINNDNPFTIEENTHFVKLVVHNDSLNTAQMNEGEVLLPYENYTGRHLSEEAKQLFGEAKGDVNKNTAYADYYPLDIEMDYSAPTMEDMSSTNEKPLEEWKSSDIYTLYDELMVKYPNYISKELIGNEPTGLPIYMYEFKPALPEDSSVVTKLPKMILLSGTHCEKTGVWVNYLALKEMCNNWKNDSYLEDLRWNVHFIVVPLVNPWGFDYDDRKNSNGVDLNRNFPTDWRHLDDPTASTYGGEFPLSEIESVFVDNLMQEHKDAIYLSDFHNFFSSVGNTQLLYNSAGTTFNINLGKMLVSKMTRKFKREYPELPQDDLSMFGFSERSPEGGIARQAATYGIQGSTFEVTNRFFNERSNGELTMKTGTETFITWLYLVLKNNIMIANR